MAATRCSRSATTPGRLDGILAGCVFPEIDFATLHTVTDTRLPQVYFQQHDGWTDAQKRAVAGFGRVGNIDNLGEAGRPAPSRRPTPPRQVPGIGNTRYPVWPSPRMVAGGPVANDVIACRLVPADARGPERSVHAGTVPNMDSPAARLAGIGIGRRVVIRHRVGEHATDALGVLVELTESSCTVQTRRGRVVIAHTAIVAAKEIPQPPAPRPR